MQTKTFVSGTKPFALTFILETCNYEARNCLDQSVIKNRRQSNMLNELLLQVKIPISSEELITKFFQSLFHSFNG